MAIQPPQDLDRFAKLLGMLGSAAEGERAAAALKATNWLAERGLRWADVVDLLKAICDGHRASASTLPHHQVALACLDANANWSEYEFDFLTNMSRRRRQPTPAQEQWLADLHGRLCESAAA